MQTERDEIHEYIDDVVMMLSTISGGVDGKLIETHKRPTRTRSFLVLFMMSRYDLLCCFVKATQRTNLIILMKLASSEDYLQKPLLGKR